MWSARPAKPVRYKHALTVSPQLSRAASTPSRPARALERPAAVSNWHATHTRACVRPVPAPQIFLSFVGGCQRGESRRWPAACGQAAPPAPRRLALKRQRLQVTRLRATEHKDAARRRSPDRYAMSSAQPSLLGIMTRARARRAAGEACGREAETGTQRWGIKRKSASSRSQLRPPCTTKAMSMMQHARDALRARGTAMDLIWSIRMVEISKVNGARTRLQRAKM